MASPFSNTFAASVVDLDSIVVNDEVAVAALVVVGLYVDVVSD